MAYLQGNLLSFREHAAWLTLAIDDSAVPCCHESVEVALCKSCFMLQGMQPAGLAGRHHMLCAKSMGCQTSADAALFVDYCRLRTTACCWQQAMPPCQCAGSPQRCDMSVGAHQPIRRFLPGGSAAAAAAAANRCAH